MKTLLSALLLGLVLHGNSNAAAVSDSEYHDFLYKRALELIKPYMVLEGQPDTRPKTEQTRAQVEDGIRLIDQVLVIWPENWAAAWVAGKAAQSLRDHERAYRYFSRAYKIGKDEPDVVRELMITCLETARTKEAVAVAEQGVRIAPRNAGLVANLALARLWHGDLAGAELAITTSLSIDPDDSISLSLARTIGQVKRGERVLPKRPSDLEK